MRRQEEYHRLRQAMPELGGISPSVRGLTSAIEGLSENVICSVVSTIELLSREARSIGLTLTVNNITQLVRALEKRDVPDILPPLHKGVSYNPNAETNGEWLMLLDFFAFIKKLSSREILGGCTILDASWYWLVNQLGDTIRPLDPTTEGAAKEILEKLDLGLYRMRDSHSLVFKTIQRRNACLRAVAEEIPGCRVISMLNLWSDKEILSYLSMALELFCERQVGGWTVVKAASYHRYGPYSPWFTPLVATEQAFLSAQGFRIRLAPVAETSWAKVMNRMSSVSKTEPYAVLMYSRSKNDKLTYSDFPFFSDSLPVLATKFTRNPDLLPIIAGYIRPFLRSEVSNDLENMVNHGHTGALEIVAEFTARIDIRARELEEAEG